MLCLRLSVAGKLLSLVAKEIASGSQLFAESVAAVSRCLAPGSPSSRSHGHTVPRSNDGETAFGRKGTAWDAAEDLFCILDQNWLSDRVRDGLPNLGPGSTSRQLYWSELGKTEWDDFINP